MPSGPGRQKFAASTTVILLLSVVGLGTRFLRQYVPSESENLFEGAAEDYLTSARGHEIQWYDLEPEAFKAARRRDRLVMLVMGDVSSRMARYADRFGFTDRDVTDRMRGSVIAVKVDGSKYPALLSSFLPFSRTQFVFEPLFQVYFLDPQGEFVSRGILGSAANLIDRRWVLDRIAEAQDAWERKRKGEGEQNRQTADLNMLDLPSEPPDLVGHLRDLRGLYTRDRGLVYLEQTQFWPSTIRFLQLNGRPEDLAVALDPYLRSSLVDWSDGGFFRQVVDTKWQMVESDKLATLNGDMAVVTAYQWRKTGDKLARRISRDAINCLIDRFGDSGSFVAYRVGDGDLLRRSKHSSYSPRFLRDNFGAAERQWYRDNLMLVVEQNPQMLPRVVRPEVIEDPLFDKMLDKLRNAKTGEKPAYGGGGQLDNSGYTLARLMEAVAYLNDAEFGERLKPFLTRLYDFRSGLDDVRKRLGNDPTPTTLRDYLAYADVCLQDYEATGRLDRVQEGAAVLRRGLTVFKGPRSGELVEGFWPLDNLNPPNSASPNLTDVLGESSIAMAVRLCLAFGSLENELKVESLTPSPENQDLVATARSIVARFSAIANRMRMQVSGFYSAAAYLQSDQRWFAVGPNCAQLAAEARVRVGARLTLPLWNLGPSQPQQPGLYVREGKVLRGPFTLEEFARESATTR